MAELLLGLETSDRATPASGRGALYIMSDGHVRVRLPDGTVHDFSLTGGVNFIDLTEQGSAPASPGASVGRMYLDNVNTLKVKLNDGTIISSSGAAAIVEYDYALRKTTADSNHDFPWQAAEQMVMPGTGEQLWQADLAGGPQWASVDLGASVKIDKVEVWHYQVGKVQGDHPTYNTDSYKLQWSNDNTAWTDFETVTGNTADSNVFTGLNLTHRYWRIRVSQGGSSAPGVARISRLKLIQTAALSLYVDAENNSYVINPDSSITYVRNDNHTDFVYTKDAPSTPPHGYATLYVNPDSKTLTLLDDTGNPHSIVSNPNIIGLVFTGTDSGLDFSGSHLLWVNSGGYLMLQGRGTIIDSNDGGYVASLIQLNSLYGVL